jgi:hypothetical protein
MRVKQAWIVQVHETKRNPKYKVSQSRACGRLAALLNATMQSSFFIFPASDQITDTEVLKAEIGWPWGTVCLFLRTLQTLVMAAKPMSILSRSEVLW